jgi:hypothetical protein
MAKVFLISTAASAASPGAADRTRIARSAQKDRFKRHQVVDDPAAADLILFFEPEDACLARDVTAHAHARRFPEKTFLIDPSDRVIPFLPGVYASIRKEQYDPARVRSGFFPEVFDHDWIAFDANGKPPELLFSFVGWIQGDPVREAIGRLRHPRAVIRETGDDPANFDETPGAALDRFHRDYAAVLVNSKFVLCPAGIGASTFRLFETMKAGRVPVILSDAWVAPEGPAWETFSLVVPARDAEGLPALLEQRETEAAAMGKRAREAWEQWFSEEAAFHRIVEWCLAIRESRRIPERIARRRVLWQLLEPYNFRRKLLPGVRRLLSG